MITQLSSHLLGKKCIIKLKDGTLIPDAEFIEAYDFVWLFKVAGVLTMISPEFFAFISVIDSTSLLDGLFGLEACDHETTEDGKENSSS